MILKKKKTNEVKIMRYIVYGIHTCEDCPEYNKFVDIYNENNNYNCVYSEDNNECPLLSDSEVKEKIIKILKENNHKDFDEICSLLMFAILENNVKNGDYY